MKHPLPGFKRSFAVIAASALLLQACAQPTSVAPPGYAAVAGDPCQVGRQALQERNDYFAASIVTGAAVGGAAAGLASGSPIRALIGAAAGAAAGSIGGYYTKKKENLASTARLAEAVHGDLSREIQEVDTTTANFLTLAECRFNAARSIKAEFQAQRVGREEAAAQLARQRALFGEDVAFAESLGAKMTQRGGEFEFASTELLKDDPAARQELEKRRLEEARLAAPAPAAGPVADAPSPALIAAPTATRPAVSPRPLQASVQPTQRLRTSPAAAPPTDVAGVAQLTESNQIKRKAFDEQVAEAKIAAGASFDLDAKISDAPRRVNLG